MGGISGGEGGVSSSSSAASGDAGGSSGTGTKSFIFGNPNTPVNSFTSTLTNPFVIVGAIAITWLILRRK